MRTYVRMGPRPWKPAEELEGALERGDLRFAMTLAEEIRVERGRAVDLSTAARFLPLIARESPKEFDSWALRWLARWIAETGSATIERAAEVAGCLADLAAEPSAIDGIVSDASRKRQ